MGIDFFPPTVSWEFRKCAVNFPISILCPAGRDSREAWHFYICVEATDTVLSNFCGCIRIVRDLTMRSFSCRLLTDAWFWDDILILKWFKKESCWVGDSNWNHWFLIFIHFFFAALRPLSLFLQPLMRVFVRSSSSESINDYVCSWVQVSCKGE